MGERLGGEGESSNGRRCGGRYRCVIILTGCHRCVFVPRTFSVLPFRTRVYPCMRACVCMSACIFMCGRVPPLTFEVGVAADQVTCVGQDPLPHPVPSPFSPRPAPPRPPPPCPSEPHPALPSPLSPYPRQRRHHLLSHALSPPLLLPPSHSLLLLHHRDSFSITRSFPRVAASCTLRHP